MSPFPPSPGRRAALRAGITAAAVILAGCLGRPGTRPSPTLAGTPTRGPGELRNPSFEDGLAGWIAGADLPEDPNEPGSRVDNNTGPSDAHAADGEYSIEFFIDGVADDGTLWVGQPVDLSDVERLAVDVYSPEESFNTLSKVAVYAGPRRVSLAEADFDTSNEVEDHAGWKTYRYAVEAVADGYVAVGISVVWETEVQRWVDAVRLD